MTKTKGNRLTIRNNVEFILRDVPQTRNDDKLLTLMYWKNYDKIVTDNNMVSPMDILNKATNTESIRRSRQLIQGEGLYLPTDATVAARRNKEVKMRDAVKRGEVV